MVEGRQIRKETLGSGEIHPPPLGEREFLESPEFRRFRAGMKKLLKIPKTDLDDMVRQAKIASPRADNPNAPGRKKNASGATQNRP